MALWYSLWWFGIFFLFWYFWTEKNLATLITTPAAEGKAFFIGKKHFLLPATDEMERRIIFFLTFFPKSRCIAAIISTFQPLKGTETFRKKKIWPRRRGQFLMSPLGATFVYLHRSWPPRGEDPTVCPSVLIRSRVCSFL
jgi:hypothetical protein